MFCVEGDSLFIFILMTTNQPKTLVLLSFFLFLTGLCTAQEGWNVIFNQRSTVSNEIPPSLKEKETTLFQRSNVEIKALGLAPDGGWVCAYESAGLPYLSWDGAPRDLMSTLQTLKEQNANIQQVVFSPLSWSGKSSWIVVYNDTEVDWKNIPPSLVTQILAVHQQHRPIKSIAMAINGGWVLVTDNDIYSSLLPAPMQSKLNSLKAQGADIHYVAFNADNGWVILYDNNQGAWERLPTDLVNTLERLSAQRSNIRAVHFYTLRGRI